MADKTLQELGREAYARAVKAAAYGEISNLFSAFTFLMRGHYERQALEALWCTGDDIAYVTDGKGYRGRAAVEAFLVTMRERARQEKLPMLAQLFPEKIQNSPEYLGAGDYEFHMLTTPHIRLADDLRTAKGAWWSPGIVSEVGPDGKLQAYLHTINYGCDFKLEEGAWKIWHLREFEEFSYPIDGALLDMEGRCGGAVRELEKRWAAGAPAPDGKGRAMDAVTRFTVPEMLADIVAPYETWDDAMSCVRVCEEENDG